MPFAEIWTWMPLDLSTYELDIRPSIISILKTDGRNRVYSGLVEEDRTKVYLIIGQRLSRASPNWFMTINSTVWESPAHREVHVAELENLREIVSIATNSGLGLQTSLVQFNYEVNGALDAPTTEITLFTLKEGVYKEDLERILLSVIDNDHVANSKHGPMTWGQIQGSPDRFCLLFGWETSKGHRDTVADPSFSHFVVDLLKAVDFESCHCDLVKRSA